MSSKNAATNFVDIVRSLILNDIYIDGVFIKMITIATNKMKHTKFSSILL